MTGKNRKFQIGLTLIELMITVVLMALVSLAVATAFAVGLDTERRHLQEQRRQERLARVEEEITRLLQGAILSADTQDRYTYFIGDNVGDTLTPLPQAGTQTTASSTATNSLSQSDSDEASEDLGCTRLTFTTVAPGIPMQTRTDSDDFETQHQQYGPLGGVSEVALSTTAVGDAGDATGLFERVQVPSDGDPGQGGTEMALLEGVQAIGFTFWNGTEWATSWNTTGTTGRRLPAAVQVSYRLRDESPEAVRRFTVPIPNSDVTPLNPVTTTGVSQ